MSEILIIRLPIDAESPVSWLIADGSGTEVIASGVLVNSTVLSELSEKASQRKVYVAVAGEAVSMHEAAVPAKSRRHLQQIIPYTLEDDVSQDIDKLHFAWPSITPSNEPIPVAAVARAHMVFWLDSLAAANIPVTQLVPDFLLLPYEQDRWSFAHFDGTWIVRQGQWRGISLEPEWLAHIEYDEQKQPAELLVIGELNWPDSIAMPAPIRQLDIDLPLLAMLRNWQQAQLNLCQGQFTQQQRRPLGWQQARWPAIAAAILCVVYLANLGATWLQIERQTQQVQLAVEARYLELLPTQQRMPVDARRRIEQQLALLGGTAQGQLLGLLSDLAPAFQEASIQLTLLQFDSARGELRIQATGQNFQTFERFQRSIRAQALEVEQGQLVSRGGRIAGTLTIRRPS